MKEKKQNLHIEGCSNSGSKIDIRIPTRIFSMIESLVGLVPKKVQREIKKELSGCAIDFDTKELSGESIKQWFSTFQDMKIEAKDERQKINIYFS